MTTRATLYYIIFSDIATHPGPWLTMFNMLLEIQYRAVAVVFYVHIYIELDTWHVVYT
jgi:hypothetical protein